MKYILGSHVSMSAPEYYLGSVKEALSYNANTFMLYTGAPQNSFRKPVDQLKVEEAIDLINSSNIDITKVIVHAPYIINLANFANESLYETSKIVLLGEIQRTNAMGLKILVLHPGSHVGLGVEEGIKSIAKGLDEVLSLDNSDVKIALETMAGKGSELGVSFEDVRKIIDLCEHRDRLGVCMDTCHMNDAGYYIHDVDSLLDEFDRIVGLDRLLVIHINDSKNPMGAHKDRHENLGYGEIGFDTIHAFVSNPRLEGIPKILETPYINGKPPYKVEIEMLRDGNFIPGWKESL